MVISYKAGPELGMIEVHTTSEGGHPIEFWSDLCIKRIISVSEEAPEEIQQQIKSFQDNIQKVIEQYMQNAIKSYKATLIQDFVKSGDTELADIIKRI